MYLQYVLNANTCIHICRVYTYTQGNIYVLTCTERIYMYTYMQGVYIYTGCSNYDIIYIISSNNNVIFVIITVLTTGTTGDRGNHRRRSAKTFKKKKVITPAHSRTKFHRCTFKKHACACARVCVCRYVYVGMYISVCISWCKVCVRVYECM